MGNSKRKKPVENIIKEYYRDILQYCKAKLQGDSYAAEDCTQEVFLVLCQKINTLDMTKDIRPWLYAVADRVIKNYIRKHPPTLDLESIPEQKQIVEFNFYGSVLDILDEEELKLLKAYFSGEDKIQLAKSYKIRLASLYMRISRIKKKLKKYLDGNNK